ncbi:7413_t:CDS:2, partial [Racocetra persica]
DEDLEKLGITDHLTRSTLGAHFWVIQVDHAIKFGLPIPKKNFVRDWKQLYGKEVLEDFSAYLDLIRMKRLAPLFKNKKFEDILEMNSQDLKGLGVELAKERIKLIKNFWRIKRRIVCSSLL